MDQLYEKKLENDIKRIEERIARLEKPQTQKLMMSLILKYSMDSHVAATLTQEQKIQKVLAMKFLHLEWLKIDKIDSLEICQNLETLYLQHNFISKIQNLDFNIKLQFLALQHNKIEKIENLQSLSALKFLDLSYNQIDSLDAHLLPRTLLFLLLKGNPCCKDEMDPQYRKPIIEWLPDLQMLDQTPVTLAQRLHYQGKAKLDLSIYLKQKKKEQEQKKPKQIKEAPELPKEQRIELLEDLKKVEEIEMLQEEAKEILVEAQEDFTEKKNKAEEIKTLIKEEVIRQDESRKEQLEKIRDLQKKLDAEREKRKKGSK